MNCSRLDCRRLGRDGDDRRNRDSRGLLRRRSRELFRLVCWNGKGLVRAVWNVEFELWVVVVVVVVGTAAVVER